MLLSAGKSSGCGSFMASVGLGCEARGWEVGEVEYCKNIKDVFSLSFQGTSAKP